MKAPEIVPESQGLLFEQIPTVTGDRVRDGWLAFLGAYPLDVFFTCTYSDEVATRGRIYNNTAALNDFQRWLDAMNYRGDYFVAAEGTENRDVPHLHGLMESTGVGLSEFWLSWFAHRGRSRFEPPSSDAARVYCTKYALKERDSDAFRFRLAGLASYEHAPRRNKRVRRR